MTTKIQSNTVTVMNATSRFLSAFCKPGMSPEEVRSLNLIFEIAMTEIEGCAAILSLLFERTKIQSKAHPKDSITAQTKLEDIKVMLPAYPAVKSVPASTNGGKKVSKTKSLLHR